MPLQLDHQFNFFAVNADTASARIIGRYIAGYSVFSDDVTRLKLNASAVQVIIQRGDKWRATKTFAGAFAINSDNGTSYYFRVPVNYDGAILVPDETTVIDNADAQRRLRDYLYTHGFKLAFFGNARTVPVPADFDKEIHFYTGTTHWLSRHATPA